jgi:hypothetical protein
MPSCSGSDGSVVVGTAVVEVVEVVELDDVVVATAIVVFAGTEVAAFVGSVESTAAGSAEHAAKRRSVPITRIALMNGPYTGVGRRSPESPSLCLSP